MKFRQALRNIFQNAVEKNQDAFIQKNPRNKQQDDTGSINFLEDFHALAELSKTQGNTTGIPVDQMIIGAPPPSVGLLNGIFPDQRSATEVLSADLPPKTADTLDTASQLNAPDDRSSLDDIAASETKQKSYSFVPKKSKANQRALEIAANKKTRSGFIKLKLEKKAQIIRQLSILMEAGMDLRSSLSILEEQEVRNKNVWLFIYDLFTKIEAGNSLSDALMSGMVKFDESEIAMIRAGEAVGKQADTLAKMAGLMEKKVFIKKKITSAMFYPATVLIVSSVVVLLLTAFVVPKFEKVIADQIGADKMPALTNIIIQISRFISSHFTEAFIAISVIIGMIIGAKTIAPIKKMVYGLLLKIPLIGDCVMKWCVVLFSRTFGDLLLCGCSVVESLKMARESVGNYYMQQKLSLTINDVQQGLSLTESLRRRSVLPTIAEGLIKVGEESGKLGEMMNKVSTSYEEQLDEVIARITSLIEPILVIFLALFVGTVVIGLFLPLVSLIQNIAT